MNTFDWTLGLRFMVAVAMGLVVGLERESTRAADRKLVLGGVRTFPILSMLGFGCAWLYREGITLILPAGLLAVAALVTAAFVVKTRTGRLGATSETSALLTFLVGAMTLLADLRLALTLGVVNALLLSEKAMLEAYVERLDKAEFLATLKFLLVTIIVLPVLPNQSFTPYALNPARIWKIVVMVSSVGFVGYFLTKKLGDRAGLWLSGLLGGIVSSTAVSVAAGRLARTEPDRAPSALQAALLASSVMYLRILVLIAILNRAAAAVVLWQGLVLAALGAVLAFTVRRHPAPAPPPEVPKVRNPFEVTTALVFAALFVGLSVVTVMVRERLGGAAVYTLAGVVGTVDVDPFILSLVQGASTGSAFLARAVLIAVMSNTLMKGIYFSALAKPVRAAAVARYGAWVLAHVPLLLAV